MSTIAFDQFALTRIADFARSLSRLHQLARRQSIDDDQIDREFNAVCLSVWGYTTDDLSDELFSADDHAWLDTLDEAQRADLRRRAGLRPGRRQRHADRLVGLLLDDPGRKARPADAGKPRRGARRDRGKIPRGAERDRRHRRAVTRVPRRYATSFRGARVSPNLESPTGLRAIAECPIVEISGSRSRARPESCVRRVRLVHLRALAAAARRSSAPRRVGSATSRPASGGGLVGEFGVHRRHLHLAEPGADLGGEAGIGGDRGEVRRSGRRRAGRRNRPPGRSAVAITSPGRSEVSSVQIDRRQAGGIAAVAGAVGAQRLAIGEGVFAVGIALAVRARSRSSMLLPKKTLASLAGQNAWHICAGDMPPRSLQREILAVAAAHAEGRSAARGDLTRGGGGGAACWLRPNGSAKKFACGGAPRCCCCCWRAAEQQIEEAFGGGDAAAPARAEPAKRSAAATSMTRRRRRRMLNSVRNAHSTRRNDRAAMRHRP